MDIDQALEPLSDKLQRWADSLVALLPNIVVALGVLVISWLLARLVRQLVIQLSQRASARAAVTRLLGTVTFLLVLTIGLFVSLGVLNLDKTVTSLLAGAGILGLAIGFAAQNLAANLLSGTVISLRRPYKEGDLIEVGDFFGVVERIDMRLTRLETPEGQLVLVPNKDMLEKPLVNYSTLEPRRVDLEVGVSYDADLETVRDLALGAVESTEGRMPDSVVEFFYTEFGSSSINFVVRFWIPSERQTDFLKARSEVLLRIKRAFDANGITIPFPIRTIDFGIEGGTNLGDALRPILEERGRHVA